jgi:hypothetical protein
MLQKPTNQPIQQQKIIEDDAKKRQRGTGFTNISKVLGANVGAGQRMGQAIGGQLGQQAEQIRKGIEQGQSQFQTGLQKEQQKQTETLGAASGALGSIMEQQPGATNYEQIGQNLRNLQYSGPSSIENIQEQQQKASNLAALGRLSGITGGQQELLRSQVADRGRYGLGQSSLDTLLLGKEGQRQLQAARAQTAATESQAQQAEKLAQAQAQAASSAAEQGKLSTINKIQGQLGDIQKTATQQGEQFISDARKYQDLASGRLDIGTGEGQVTKEEAQNLVERAEAGEFGNLDVDGIYSGEEAVTNATIQAIVNAMKMPFGQKKYTEEQQRQAADLATLLAGSKSGQEISNLKYNTLYNPTEEEKKGFLGAQEEAKSRAATAMKNDALDPNRLWTLGRMPRPGEQGKLGAEIDAYFNSLPPDLRENAKSAYYSGRIHNRVDKVKQLINNYDFTKAPEITKKERGLFGLIREKLGLPKKVVMADQFGPGPRKMTQI